MTPPTADVFSTYAAYRSRVKSLDIVALVYTLVCWGPQAQQFKAEVTLSVPTLMPKNDTIHYRRVQHICSLWKQSEITRYCCIVLHAGMLGSPGTTI